MFALLGFYAFAIGAIVGSFLNVVIHRYPREELTESMVKPSAKIAQGFETQGIKLLIDPKASLFLIGTEMDYEEEKLKQGFVFKNPNEKGRCGCGESFHV